MSSHHTATHFADLAHPSDHGTARDLFDEAINRGHAQRTLRVRDIAGDRRHLHLILDRYHGVHGQDDDSGAGGPGELTVQGWDVTQLLEQQQALRIQPFRDPLTALPNRLAFMARLDQELGMSRLPRHRVAVLFADIDDFRLTNQKYGYAVGDQVLIELSLRLAQSLRPGDLLGRVGGDEFAVVCPDLNGWAAASAVVDRLRLVAAQPIPTPAGVVSVTMSLGAAFAEESDGRPDVAADLMARADHRITRDSSADGVPVLGNGATVVSA